jgi:Fic family protein
VGGERVRAFNPRPLSELPPVPLDGALQSLHERAALGLGRLDGLASLLPSPDVFLYAYVRKEAVLSSQIEGTQSSLAELLLFEIDEAPGVPLDDVVETSNYVEAMELGIELLATLPLSVRLLHEVHKRLLARGRGSDKSPGAFRRTQNWVGGTRPTTAEYVPPPPNKVAAAMADLERFINDKNPGTSVLVRAAVAHVQFESIHPYLDGNGRVGRLLIVLLLIEARALQRPLLYLSLYFKQNRGLYYELLNEVRSSGSWKNWLEFFLTGVVETSENTVAAARRLLALFEVDRERIQKQGRSAGSALRVHDALIRRPLGALPSFANRTGLSFPATAAAVARLEDLGIVREITGRRRDRIYSYAAYLKELSEGAEPIPR